MELSHGSKLYVPMQMCPCESESCNSMVPYGNLVFADENLALRTIGLVQQNFGMQIAHLKLYTSLDDIEREMAMAKLTPRERVLLGLVSDGTF